MTVAPVRVLFVCTGNICRSPLAEALFKHYVREDHLGDHFEVDSAGLDSWHVGECADPRTCRVARDNGIEIDGVARQFEARDFERFDVIVAMDRGHHRALLSRAPARHKPKVQLMRDYDEPAHHGTDVPDPYYGGPEGFDSMYRMLARSCRNLLDSLKPR